MKRLRSPAETSASSMEPQHASSHSGGDSTLPPPLKATNDEHMQRRRATKGKPQEAVAVPLADVLTTSGMLRATRPLSNNPKIPPNKVGTLELYKRFPQEYDLLMAKHDCSILSSVVGELLSEQGRRHGCEGLRIADLGCGTGRLLCLALAEAATRGVSVDLLCGYDKEAAMLRVAKAKLDAECKRLHDAVPLRVLDRAEDWAVPLASSDAPATRAALCLRPFDFQHIRLGALSQASAHPALHMVVCAWSLSYVMRASWGGDRWHQELKDTVEAMQAAVVGGGVLVIIETLGNGCETPTRRNSMLDFLEETFGFERQWVRTDYVFASVQEGESMCKFFFAQGVADRFKANGSCTLPECTGIWTKRMPPRATASSSQQ